MSTRLFIIVQSVICFLFGSVLLLAPQFMLSAFSDTTVSSTGILDFVLRAYGTPLLGISILAFIIRDSEDALTRRGFVLGTSVTALLITSLHIWAISTGLENSTAWGTVAITGLSAVWGFAILLGKKG